MHYRTTLYNAILKFKNNKYILVEEDKESEHASLNDCLLYMEKQYVRNLPSVLPKLCSSQHDNST